MTEIRGGPLLSLVTLLREIPSERPAFTDARRTLTFGELLDSSGRLATGLGIARGDRVLVHLGARVEFAEHCLAVLRAGGVGVPASARSTAAVVHSAAVVVADAAFTAQTPVGFGTVFRPKADAAQLLHEATRRLPLSAFVLFSSLAGIFGNAGQSGAGPRASCSALGGCESHFRNLHRCESGFRNTSPYRTRGERRPNSRDQERNSRDQTANSMNAVRSREIAA